jgi:acetyltransferase-like isoleucine patch superfamily enzyme
MNKYLKFFWRLNFKTIYFNFKYLKFKQAVWFPFLISRKVYLKKVKGKVILECPVRTGLVQFGYGDVGIFDKKLSRSIWEVSGTVIFRGKSNLGHGSKISVANTGTLILGDGFKISAETSIYASSRVEFGNNCLLSWEILIMDTDFHKILNGHGEIINHPEPIIIGNKVWIGCRSLILKGAKIPDNCIIAANTIVRRVLEKENCIYGGYRAKCLKEDISWKP